MDISPFLAPISIDDPAGADLSFSTEIDSIQEMRREDDPTLDQGAWVSALKSADWAGVARQCVTVLSTKSKDLRVAGWLVDAWARLGGFERLADGLELVSGLIEQHWDHLHPLPEDGDHEQRVGNLRWLATRVEQLAPSIPLVVHGGGKTTLLAIQAARSRRLAGAGNVGLPSSPTDGATTAEPVPTLEAIWRDVSAGGREAARQRRAHVMRAQSALAVLAVAVDARLGDDAPSFAAPRSALDKVLDELTRLERECGFEESSLLQVVGLDSEAHTASTSETTPNHASVQPMQRPPGRIETRAQALEQLRLVASFFRANEPHSPVAYLADKAVHWSEMPLHEWLRAVVKDGVSLAHLEELLGVDKLEASSS